MTRRSLKFSHPASTTADTPSHLFDISNITGSQPQSSQTIGMESSPSTSDPSRELTSLMKSLSGSINSSSTSFQLPIRQSKKKGVGRSHPPQTPGAALQSTLGNLNIAGMTPPHLSSPASSGINEKPSQPMILRFGSEISLRCAAHRGFLCADVDGKLEAAGTGNGSNSEIFTLVNVHVRGDTGPVRFGDVIALCSTAPGAGNGRFLSCETAVADSKSKDEGRTDQLKIVSGPALNRSTFGSAEKWTLVSTTSTRDQSKKLKRTCVCSGDLVVLKSVRGNFLSPSPVDSSIVSEPLKTICLSRKPTTAAWTIAKARTPCQPHWARQRPFLTGDFISNGVSSSNEKEVNINGQPVELQEQMLVEDILYAMVGIEGRYISFSSSTESRSFTLDQSSLDPSLAFLANRLLPLCADYVKLERYVSRHMNYEFGRTVHAFSAAVKQLLREYTLLVTQLEHQYRSVRLTLQELWFFVQPSMQLMKSLSLLCEETEHEVGGALLNAIDSAAQLGGDPRSQQLYRYLTEKAAAPYLRMLESWIFRGAVNDNHDEFMIRENRYLSKDRLADDYNADYWDRRYTVREGQLPWFLKPHADKILATGKYLNVIRECGRVIDCPLREIHFRSESFGYAKTVDDCYRFASRTLLDMLLKDAGLMEHLHSLKLFFFQAQGDVFVHFRQIAGSELAKNFLEIDVGKLGSLLNVAIGDSSITADPNTENISCALEPIKLFHLLEAVHLTSAENAKVPHGPNIDARAAAAAALRNARSASAGASVSGIEAFSLDYQVEWPLSLVISRQALIKYQILFRHLFFCKHVEHELCDAWLHQHTAKELHVQAAMRVSYCLRQRMLHFVQNLVYYVTVEVLEPRWHEMHSRMRAVSTVDEVLRNHNDFLDCCLKESLLTNPVLIRLLTKLMTTCLLFADKVKRFYASSSLGADDPRVATVRPSNLEEQKTDDFEEAERKRLMRKARISRGGLAGAPHNSGSAHSKVSKLGEGRERRNSLDLRRTRIEVQSEHIRQHVDGEAYRRMLAGFAGNFDGLLMQFMAALQDEHHAEYHMHLANVFTRLDYNSFYARRHNEMRAALKSRH